MAAGYDHDHETDQVRAALCVHHNTTLRAVGDTSESLRTLAAWLESADLGFTFSEYTHDKNQQRWALLYSTPVYRAQRSERRYARIANALPPQRNTH